MKMRRSYVLLIINQAQKALDLTEVYYGLALQMLTYLDVVTSNAQTWMKKGGTITGCVCTVLPYP